MTIITQSYDDTIYKLVPIDSGEEILKQLSENHHSTDDWTDEYKKLLAVVPANLPGVVTHSGEPVAWLHILDNTEGDEGSEPVNHLSFHKEHSFGIPGKDFSKEYPVTSKMLYTIANAAVAAHVAQQNNWHSGTQEPAEYGGYIVMQPGADRACHAYFGHPYGQPETGWYSSGGTTSGPIIPPVHWCEFPIVPNQTEQLAQPMLEAVVAAALEAAIEVVSEVPGDSLDPQADCVVAIRALDHAEIIQAAREEK